MQRGSMLNRPARVILPSPVYADPVAVPAPQPQAAPDGVVRQYVEVHFDRLGRWEASGLAGLAQVPAGWHARIVVTRADARPGIVYVTPFAGDPDVVPAALGSRPDAHVFEVTACGAPTPIRLHAAAPATDGPAGGVTLAVSAELSLAGCRPVDH